MSRLGLIIFARRAELGKVKTRLAQGVGELIALRIYQALLAYTKTVIAAVKARRYVYYYEAIDKEDIWASADVEQRVQVDGDLGDKMKSAFAEVLELHEQAVIIGSDCPQITPELIMQAAGLLEQCDVVIGPTHDGGYYLLGIKALHVELWVDIPWSTGREYQETIRQCLRKGLRVVALPVLIDIDYAEDWEAYGWPLD